MGINGYELKGIAYVRAGGPMWRTVTPNGDKALLTLHTQGDADCYMDRWKRWATISSPHVASLYDVIAHEDGRWALVQAEIPGDTLALLVESRDDLLKVHGQKIAEGIRAGIEDLHRVGVVHGDIAPKNIIITPEGRPVIIDLIGLRDDHAGTPGWSDTFGVDQKPSMEADLRAFERIRTALTTLVTATPTATSCDPSNPGMRLRAHGDLPETERRPSRFSSWAHITGRTESDGRTHDAPSTSSSRQRTLTSRRILAIGVIVAAIIAGVGSLRVFAQPDSVATRAAHSHPHSQSHTHLHSHPHSHELGDQATSTQDSPNDCPAPDEVLKRLTDILDARDAAYNHGDAAGLERFMDGQWLSIDQHNIATMTANNMRISGFSTTAISPTLEHCTKDVLRIRTQLRAASYTLCTSEGCTEASASTDQPPQVLITLRRSDLVLTSVDEAAPAS